MTTAKLTPAQNALLKQIREAGHHGMWLTGRVPVNNATLAGLERRGLAVVRAGRIYLTGGA